MYVDPRCARGRFQLRARLCGRGSCTRSARIHATASAADLAALWSTIEPERGLALHTDNNGTRLFLSEACEPAHADAAAAAAGPIATAAAVAAGALSRRADGRCMRVIVDFTLSLDLNHAFAVHHWTAPAWQLAAAESVLVHWMDHWWQRDNAAACTSPCAALLPSLLRPRLASTLANDALGIAAAALDGERIDRHQRDSSEGSTSVRTRLLRLGMYADGRDHLDV